MPTASDGAVVFRPGPWDDGRLGDLLAALKVTDRLFHPGRQFGIPLRLQLDQDGFQARDEVHNHGKARFDQQCAQYDPAAPIETAILPFNEPLIPLYEITEI